MRTVLSIANYNMHCGMDGWGRPYDYVAAIAALDADVIVLEEAWTVGRRRRAAGRRRRRPGILGYQVVAHTLGSGRRIRPQPDGARRWLARPVWRDENKALYMDGVRPVSARVRAVARWQEAEQGTWGIAILVRPALAIEATRVLPMRTLRADRVTRAGLVVDLTVDGSTDFGGGHPHVASAHGLAPQLGRAAPAAAHLGPAGRGAGRRHEHVGALGEAVHAGLAAGRRGPDVADVAAAQPDRPHLGAGGGCGRWRAWSSRTRVPTTGRCGPRSRSDSGSVDEP